ncbi:MAG: hypothetical protein ACRD6X_15945 [Pyrinomonadaceae bacterium]
MFRRNRIANITTALAAFAGKDACVPVMKYLSQTAGLIGLDTIRSRFTQEIRSGYEHRAKSCETCETPGACCLDVHFVNIRITRLEAATIAKRLGELPVESRDIVIQRIENSIEKFELLSDRPMENRFFACPLYEKGIGCLVHESGKPLPCIAHACYSKRGDLPPDELLIEREIEVEKLNAKVYGKAAVQLPLPVAIHNVLFA